MSDTRTNWLQLILSVIGMAGIVVVAYVSMSTQAAVQGEQIKQIQSETRTLTSSTEHNAEHIRLSERAMDGLAPVVNAIKATSDSNAIKLDALLLRGRVSDTRLVSTCEENR